VTRRSLFVHHNGTRGDVLFSRAVISALLAHGGFDLVLGACRGDEELLADLQGPHCRIVTAALRNTPHGAPIDLVHLCPPDATPLSVWLGGNEAKPNYQDLRRLGCEHTVADPETVPMLDFAGHAPVPALARPAVFVDTQRTADDACHFVWDLQRLARVLPACDLLCTAPPPTFADNVRDVSHLSWPQRSRLSEQCVALVGTTREPFAVTLTEANRWKPKALCGHDARVTAPFWDYAGNPLELLASMDDLVDFLIANVASGAGR